MSLRFGAVGALEDVSFTVGDGEVFAVIGPNGAGKTSLFNVLSCIYPPSAGRLRCFGTDLARLRPHQLAHLGIARTFQNLGLFRGMSVVENLLTGRNLAVRAGLYATGNSTASVMGRCYPGAGASIGASFVFAWIAAHHAVGQLPN